MEAAEENLQGLDCCKSISEAKDLSPIAVVHDDVAGIKGMDETNETTLN